MFSSQIRSDTCRRKNQACYDTTALHVQHDHLKTLNGLCWCCICCTPMAHFSTLTITKHTQTYPNIWTVGEYGLPTLCCNSSSWRRSAPVMGKVMVTGDGFGNFMTISWPWLISLMLPASMKVILAQANAEDTIWIHMILHHQFYFYLRIIFFTKWFRPTTSMKCKVWRYNSWTELDGSIFLLCCSGMVTWCHGSGSEALCVSDAVQTQCISELLTAWQLPSAFASRWRIESHAAS